MNIDKVFGLGSVKIKTMLEGSSLTAEVKEGFDRKNNHIEPRSKNNGSIVKKVRIWENEDTTTDSSSESQDADYTTQTPSLSSELESLIFARLPLSHHWKLSLINKTCLNLLKTGDLYTIRKQINLKEPSIFMLASGETTWWAFDRHFTHRRKLPILPSDPCFASGDKESLCAATHLLVSGREIDGLVIWRYDLSQNKWQKGPSMITPRCLFASAANGDSAYVAGGMAASSANDVFDTAEKYNPESGSWEPLPRMKKRRKLCAGFYMDDKFYVVGGRNGDGELTCGEFFDERRNRWELIPEMLKDDPVRSSQSPPLVAVVKNELYSLEAWSNRLKLYVKKTNTWRELGRAPVRADCNRGWGVAFKSLGDELLVMGASADCCSGNYMAIYTCCPDLESSELRWKLVDTGGNRLSHFILNCSVMVA